MMKIINHNKHHTCIILFTLYGLSKCSFSADVVALAIHFNLTVFPIQIQVTVTHTPVTDIITPLLKKMQSTYDQ